MSAQVFRLPDLGEGLTEAEIVEWLVAVGDEVTIDQNVVTVETAKATVEVPVPFAGTVSALHGEIGQLLEVGAPLITVGGAAAEGQATGSDPRAGHEQYRTEERAGAAPPEGSDTTEDEGSGAVLIGFGTGHGKTGRRARRPRGAAAPATATAPVAPVTEQSPAPAAPTAGQPATAVTGGQAPKVISPLVRREAAERGIDLATLTPSQPDGIIRRADLEQASGEPTAEQAPAQTAAAATGSTAPATGTRTTGLRDEREPLTGVMRIMTERLTTSRREIPEATTWVDADATELMRAKDALKTARPEAGIGILPLVARFVVAGLHRFPALNASVEMEDGRAVAVQRHARVNLGFAAQSPRGLVVPVVHDAQDMTTSELAAALRELTGLAREGRLSPAQLTGGTFTLNNYGVFGVDGSTPIINHPEAAMLGVGRIVDRPWAVDGEVRVRKVTQLGFTFDHRVCDGGTAGGFLRFVADAVENPTVLLAEL
ncbi:pyruvate dehydrogenase E2 component (dihydrolipoamide acetyltransferase) [Kytococcus aerolatus]|uniref:Dihydrolipoamide acetyltransferase component of pyruvate dehydrogenase complex n=1 Tax=Kytococcus aerolatus TaxID=592308 RepID=A0A212U5V6_9MICO|nr:dihydrolipoamide acetyltransferase family protein [Kytococcus aerolatus]SNC73464.1 pyruvate dehydrogenase E2 component (dihydrolipoamide acetyltransferase) [Kytococcus aerolatus]